MRYPMALLTVGLLLAACKPTSSATAPASPTTDPAPTTAAAAPASVPVEAGPAIETGFSEGMPYATLRGRLLQAGWLPLRDPACRENVGGEATVCFELPEVESCSGDGYCNMGFANAAAGKRMVVTTYGPYERWNTPGEEAALAVRSWDVSVLGTAPAAAPACPSPEFDAFLKAFATDAQIRRAFTAPVVKVAELGGGEDGGETVPVYVDGAHYAGFNVVHDGKAFHFVDGEGATDPAALPLEIQARGADAREVRYRYGMSEGNSYRFERKDGCWRLTEDPEPPSP